MTFFVFWYVQLVYYRYLFCYYVDIYIYSNLLSLFGYYISVFLLLFSPPISVSIYTRGLSTCGALRTYSVSTLTGCPYMDVTSLLLLSDNYCNNIALSQSATDTPQNSEIGQVCRMLRPQYYRLVSYCYVIG